MKTSIKDLPKIDSSICAACGGACCKSVPGIYAPSDFGKSHKEILKNVALAFDREEICLDCWEGDGTIEDPTMYFVRPRIVNKRHKRIDYTWGGTCFNLTPHGCSLEFNKRPMQCRELVPVVGTFNCRFLHSRYTKNGMAKRWLSFSAELFKLANIEEE
jgi:Fe-S-cluster containining protein